MARASLLAQRDFSSAKSIRKRIVNLIQLVVPRKTIHSLPFFGLILFVIAFVRHRQDATVDVQTTASQSQSHFVASLCNCDKQVSEAPEFIHSQDGEEELDWCGPESSARGKHQKVITYSLYGNANNTETFKRYYSLLRNISSTAANEYPGWIIRIYHNISQSDEAYNQLCDVYCRSTNVDLCSLPNLIDRIGAVNATTPVHLLRNLNPRMFRFLVMSDPNVDVFLSRDVDSLIWPREVAAVGDWLRSNYTFHVMRDHKVQISIMLAGMWGAKIDRQRNVMQQLMKSLAVSGQNQIKWQDQISLEAIVWPVAKFDVMAHDSYQCENVNIVQKSPLKVFPFPEKRDGKYYVGGAGGQLYPVECPVACRPAQHKDWEFC